MFRERIAARILLPILTVLMVFSIMSFGVFSYLRFVIVNLEFLKSSIVNNTMLDDVYDEIVEDVLESVDLESADLDYAEAEELFKEVFDKEFVDFVLDETFDAILDGDLEINEEYLDSWLDKNEVILKEHGFDKEDVESFKEEMHFVINTVVEESSEVKVEVFGQVEETIGETLNVFVNTYMTYSGIATLIMLVVLLLVCKNKFAPIRNFGISLTVASGVLFLILGILWAIFQEIAYSSDYDEFAYSVLMQYLRVGFVPLVIALLAGIALIVLGAVLGSKYVNSFNDNDDSSYDNEFGNYNTID